MITNDVQYRLTKTLLTQFEEAARNLETGLADAKNKKLQFDAARAQADDFTVELTEYERLRSGAITSFEADLLAALSILLVQARVARGWSQRQLAAEVGVAEQQIQRYEANRYATASLARLCEIANALGLRVRETGELLADTPAA